jgi:hypothetical protein
VPRLLLDIPALLPVVARRLSVSLASGGKMGNRTLLLWQKNQLFQEIHERGLQPSTFKWEEVPSYPNTQDKVSSLVHIETQFYFTFDFRGSDDYWQARYFPQEEKRKQGLTTCHNGEATVTAFVSWLEMIKRDVLEPDLWGAIAAEQRLSEVAGQIEGENTPFTREEYDRIGRSLLEIKEYLLTIQDLDAKQRDFIEARFRYLQDAASRLGRKDWITLALGVLTNIVVGAALSPDAARELFRTAGRLLEWLMPGTGLLP